MSRLAKKIELLEKRFQKEFGKPCSFTAEDEDSLFVEAVFAAAENLIESEARKYGICRGGEAKIE